MGSFRESPSPEPPLREPIRTLLPRISQAPALVGAAPRRSLSIQESNGARVTDSGATSDEVTPGARMRGLVNSLALTGELVLERSAVDGLAQFELLRKTFPVGARDG
jgi:hypothetical protein